VQPIPAKSLSPEICFPCPKQFGSFGGFGTNSPSTDHKLDQA